MKKLFALGLSASMFLSLVGGVFARPDFKPAEVSNPKTGDKYSVVVVPENAVQVAPALFDLGTSTDVDGRLVQGYMFIHYKKGYHHRPGHDKGPGGNGGGGEKCFAFLAKDAKWKVVEDYLVDSSSTVGLSDSFVRSTVAGGIAKWEDAVDGTVGDGSSINIIGDETSGTVDGADTSSPDGKNEVLFGDIDSPSAIAVTIVWGFFNGPPFARELVEWDQVYDVDFDWSSSGEDGKMDFGNIAQHELGHSFGMGHPDDSCTEETMYRFAAFGEIIKRDLNAGDIAGISKLYK